MFLIDHFTRSGKVVLGLKDLWVFLGTSFPVNVKEDNLVRSVQK